MLKIPNTYEFLCADAKNPNLVVSAQLLIEESPVGKTMKGIFEGTADNYLMYNDAPPDGRVSITKGHTKGVMMVAGDNLTWIIHSVPNFPPQKAKGYSYPGTGKRYGQSFLCLTFSTDQINTLAGQLLFTYPNIYEHNFDTSKVGPELRQVLEDKHVNNPPWTSVKELTSKNGIKITHLAKFTDYREDLYSGMLTNHYERSFYTETWQNAVGRLNSSCGGAYTVENIAEVNMVGRGYKETQDHSKWAISTEGDIMCVGGINRGEKQLKRAGGIACFNEAPLVGQIRGSIVRVESCSKRI